MSTSITVPEGYQYVGAALLSTVWTLGYQTYVVGQSRKKAGVQYPQFYAEKAEVEANFNARIFNCAQRAHYNTLECLPMIYTTTLIAGLKYPVYAAVGCALWSLGRVSYTHGYTTGNPKKRVTFSYQVSSLGLLGLILTSTYIAGEWVVAGISKAT